MTELEAVHNACLAMPRRQTVLVRLGSLPRAWKARGAGGMECVFFSCVFVSTTGSSEACLFGARSRASPATLRSHPKSDVRWLGHEVQGFLWLFSSPVGAWDPWDHGTRGSGRRNWSLHECTQPPALCLVSVHPSRCRLLPGGKPVLGLGPHSGGWWSAPDHLPIFPWDPNSSAWEAGPFLAGRHDLEAWFCPG